MVSFFIAKRYFISKNRQKVINIISYITTFVLVIGTASLVVVLSGFAGLQSFTVHFINLFDPDLKLSPTEGKTLIYTDAQLQQLDDIEGIASYSKVLEERVFLSFINKNDIAKIKGVEHQYTEVTGIDTLIPIGNWEIEKYRVVINNTTAKKLGIGIYEQDNFLKMIVPKYGRDIKTTLDTPYSQMHVVVAGIYQSNYEFDSNYIFSELSLVQKFLKKKSNDISSIEIRLKDHADENIVKAQIQHIFGEKISTKNRFEQNATIFKMLNTEKIVLIGIFIIVLLIAFFNLSGFLLVDILSKKKDIKTLSVLGLKTSLLRFIFMLKGVLISLFAAGGGVLLGALVVFLQNYTEFVMISMTTPYPMELHIEDIVLVFAVILFMGTIISAIASKRIGSKFIHED